MQINWYWKSIPLALLLVACRSASESGVGESPNYAVIPATEQSDTTGAWAGLKSLQLDTTALLQREIWAALRDYAFGGPSLVLGAATNVRVVLDTGLVRSTLNVQDRGIELLLRDSSQLYRGLSLLSQLGVLNAGRLPVGAYHYRPRFVYRGMHLDVARHFFPKEALFKYLDFLFFYGYNKFHWHLTEDQGWRIEIKRYPKLQTVAAYREETLVGHYNDTPQRFDGQRYGGYYTQAEVREIVAYAAAKGIEVIPEIELPGHSLAAISAYPELSCDPTRSYAVATKWGIFDDIYCPTEKTFQFLEGVFDEVTALFPSRYIHIGGDEAPKGAWRESAFCQDLIEREGLVDEAGLQSYFIRRVERYLNERGRQIIGWDEILEGGLAPKASVMSWRGTEGGIAAALADHQVVMTPTSHCYFDYYQSDHPEEPLAIGGLTPLEKVYAFEPIPAELPVEKHRYIWGAQGNVWTEYLPDFAKVEYMALARMAALSEVLYRDSTQRRFADFAQRLQTHLDYWEGQSVNVAQRLLDLRFDLAGGNAVPLRVTDLRASVAARVEQQGPGDDTWTAVEGTSAVLNEPGIYAFRAVDEAGRVGRATRVHYEPHLGLGATIELAQPPDRRYPGRGGSGLLNGIKGSDEKYGDREWLGFSGEDLEATIRFAEPRVLRRVGLRFFDGEGQWIYLPREVELLASTDGQTFRSLARRSDWQRRAKVEEVEVALEAVEATHLRVVAKNYGEIPEGRQGEGYRAWLFVDEISIE
ncbi:MAG: family 20 glycosylhydrolase [Bacteroidota bacterium]